MDAPAGTTQAHRLSHFQVLMLVLTALAISIGGVIAYWITHDITRAPGRGDLGHDLNLAG